MHTDCGLLLWVETKKIFYCYSGRDRKALIDLSEKVLTSADRVRDTLVHELCHAAVWIIDGNRDGHGKNWKYW